PAHSTTTASQALHASARLAVVGRRAPLDRIASIPLADLRPGLSRLRLAFACRSAADLVHEQLVGPMSANDGHAAITRLAAVGWATATLAARLAALPATRSAQGSFPPRSPARESASRVVEAATIIPSTDSGVSAATQPGWPCSSTSVCMCK